MGGGPAGALSSIFHLLQGCAQRTVCENHKRNIEEPLGTFFFLLLLFCCIRGITDLWISKSHAALKLYGHGSIVLDLLVMDPGFPGVLQP